MEANTKSLSLPVGGVIALACLEADETRSIYLGSVVKDGNHKEEVEVWWMEPRDPSNPAAEYFLSEFVTKNNKRQSYIQVVDRAFILGAVEGVTADLKTGATTGVVGAKRWAELQTLLNDIDMTDSCE